MADEELKAVQEEFVKSVKDLTDAVRETKDRFGDQTPADIALKLEEMGKAVTDLSAQVTRLDEKPAFKRAFDLDGTGAARQMPFERKMRVPSHKSGDEDMAEIFLLQDALEILRFAKRHDGSWDQTQTKTYARLKEAIERKAAYDGTTAGRGTEWIPTGYSPDLIMLFELERQVAGIFGMVNMPNDPFKIPTQTGAAVAYKKSRSTDPTESESTSDAITLSCSTVAAYSKVAYEVEEDAIVAMVPFIRQDLAMALATGEENCIINGDTTASHQDEDVTGSADVRKCWKGLRKLAIAGSDTYDMGDPTTLKLRYMRGMMSKYGVNPRRLAWVVSPIGLIHLLSLDEVLTVDKLGANATLISGQMGSFDGAPVVVSGLMRDDLAATGLYDADGDHTKTGILLVNTTGYVLGRRRAPMIESFRDVVAGADEIVASMREDFQPRYAATEPLCIYGYDVPNQITVGS